MSMIKEELKGKQKRNMSYTNLLYPEYSTKIINKYKGTPKYIMNPTNSCKDGFWGFLLILNPM